MTDWVDEADFHTKQSKRNLEIMNAGFIKHTGGWFGIPGPAVEEHCKLYNEIMRSGSVALLAEIDHGRYMEMIKTLKAAKDIKAPERVFLYHEELFTLLRRYQQKFPNPVTPMFRYGHLDFCITAPILLRDHAIYSNLIWLAQWNQLKDPFYLDITVSTRNDKQRGSLHLFESTIVQIFLACGWNVKHNIERPVNEGCHYTLGYRDGAPMHNALYKFEKMKDRRRGF